MMRAFVVGSVRGVSIERVLVRRGEGGASAASGRGLGRPGPRLGLSWSCLGRGVGCAPGGVSMASFSSALGGSGPAINADGTLKKFPTPVAEGPVCVAASRGDMDALRAAGEGELGQSDASGNSPLVWAADAGHAEATAFLVGSGVDVNHRGFIGNTALARAARGGHVGCVEALLASPATDPNICNDKMQYPLHFAAFKKKRECVKVLLESGRCDLTVKDRKGRTPDQDTSDDGIRDMIVEAGKRA